MGGKALTKKSVGCWLRFLDCNQGTHTPVRIPPFDTPFLHKTVLRLLKGVR
jgi:hypothetical protein|eukprot:COSAG06_NODE_708_length_12893_cov_10.008676_4_plen_51_part_00